MIESIDLLTRGSWWVIARGPKKPVRNEYNSIVHLEDRSFVGQLVHVLAIAPPVVFAEIHPVPCGDPAHAHVMVTTTFRFEDFGLTHASRAYVRAFRKANDHGAPPQPSGHEDGYSTDTYGRKPRGH